MHMDPLLPALVAAAFGILLIGAVSRRFKQPHVVGYLIAGILLGPHGVSLLEEPLVLARMGEIGVLLLLFFVGMEVDLRRLVTGWRVSVIGTALQILLSIGCIAVFGHLLGWSLPRILLLGFAISLSSTALALSMLRDRGELETQTGQDVLGILLVQDVALVPMLILIGVVAGNGIDPSQLARQVAGGLAFAGLLFWLAQGKPLHLPFGRHIHVDHEMQVFAAFLLCFGLAVVTGWLGLSTAMGAFAAGMIVAATKETAWLHRSLEPFRVLLVAVFFVSIGCLIDLEYLSSHWRVILGLVSAALITNTLINAIILRALGRGWREALYASALLSQIGELSFVIAAVGKQSGILAESGYQLVISTIAGTLLLTPLWITLLRRPVPAREPRLAPQAP